VRNSRRDFADGDGVRSAGAPGSTSLLPVTFSMVTSARREWRALEFGVSRDADFDVEIIARAAGRREVRRYRRKLVENGNEGRPNFVFCFCRR